MTRGDPGPRSRKCATTPSRAPISVLMPVFNGAPYLERALRSILDQTERDFELIVIDDGSTDGSLAILRRFAAGDARVRLVSRANRGLVATLNEMLALARAPFLARMDADDIAEPLRFERELQALAADPSLVAVGCSVHFIDPADRRLMTFAYPSATRRSSTGSWRSSGNGMSHPALMMRAEAVAALGGYRAEFWPRGPIYCFAWPRSAASTPCEPLLSYRLHPQSIGQLNVARQRDAHFRCVARRRAARLAAAGRDAACRQARSRWTMPSATSAGPWWRSAAATALGALARARRVAARPWRRASWHVMACAIRGH